MLFKFIGLFTATIGATIIFYFIGTRFVNKTKVSNTAINIGLLIALFIAIATTYLLSGTNEELAVKNAWLAGFVGTVIAILSIVLKGRSKEIETGSDTPTSSSIDNLEKKDNDEMVYCQDCGKKIKNTDKFCQYCGKKTGN